MKIAADTQKYLSPADTAVKKAAVRQTEESGKSAKQQSDAFSVQLSGAVEQMKTSSDESDAVRQAKVDAIRQQLATGTYNISGKDVADKIIGVLKG